LDFLVITCPVSEISGSVSERSISEGAESSYLVVVMTVQGLTFNLLLLCGSYHISHRRRIRCWVIEKHAPELRCQSYLIANKFFSE
jgi:hypothetical protein